MDELFELPVDYKGGEIVLPGKLVRRGYSYRLHISVEEVDVVFEPDEERNFRAIIDNPDLQGKINIDLVRAIGEALDKIFR
ncbi:MAG: hypothetical protein JNL51_13430 [Chitinophagaceae bacterium]|nr:hypothetical protein [Chitinophagaceae bacterium]